MESVIDTSEVLQAQVLTAAMPVLDYFEDIYIRRPTHNARRPLSFNIQIWNIMFNRGRDELLRTNNLIEGWHCSYQAGINYHHPNVWRSLNSLQNKSALQEARCNQLLVGHASRLPKKRHAANNAITLHIVCQLQPRFSQLSAQDCTHFLLTHLCTLLQGIYFNFV